MPEDTPDLRTAVVRKLGGKCSRCGWSADEALLQVVDTEGNSTEQWKGRARERYFLMILTATDTRRYVVLCPNCNGLYMKHRRTEQAAEVRAAEATRIPAHPEPQTLPVFVWPTELALEICLRSKFGFMEKAIREGLEAYILAEDGKVYRYPEGKQVAESWEEFTEREHLEPERPYESKRVDRQQHVRR